MVEEADEVVLSSPRTSPSGRDREGVGVDFKSAAGTSQKLLQLIKLLKQVRRSPLPQDLSTLVLYLHWFRTGGALLLILLSSFLQSKHCLHHVCIQCTCMEALRGLI